jgi:hypothetical protein
MERFIAGFARGLCLWGAVMLLLGYAHIAPLAPVRGLRARIIAIIAMLPLPLARLLGYFYGAVAAWSGWQIARIGMFVEVALLALALGAGYLIASGARDSADKASAEPVAAADGGRDPGCVALNVRKFQFPIWSAYVIAPLFILLCSSQVIVRSESPLILIAFAGVAGLICGAAIHAYIGMKRWVLRRLSE